MLDYAYNNGKEDYKAAMNILVCVTHQKTCERMINKTNELLQAYGGNLFIINVVKNEFNFLDSAKEAEALEYLFGISKKLGANLSVLKSDDIPGTIAKYAEDNDIDCIVIGKSHDKNAGERFVKRLQSLLKNKVEIRILS